MKKFLSVLIVTSALALMGSCDDNNEGNSEIDGKLVKYEQTCNRVSELGEKVKSGDTRVAEEYAEAAMQMSRQAQDLESHADEMNSEQTKRMEKAAFRVPKSVE